LNIVAVDQLQPLLSDLIQSLSQITSLGVDYQGKAKILDWLKRLNRLKASDELSENDSRQLAFDLDNALSEFHNFLAKSK